MAGTSKSKKQSTGLLPCISASSCAGKLAVWGVDKVAPTKRSLPSKFNVTPTDRAICRILVTATPTCARQKCFRAISRICAMRHVAVSGAKILPIAFGRVPGFSSAMRWPQGGSRNKASLPLGKQANQRGQVLEKGISFSSCSRLTQMLQAQPRRSRGNVCGEGAQGLGHRGARGRSCTGRVVG